MKNPLVMPPRMAKHDADRLRDLWLRLLPEEKVQLESMWPEMKGYWPTEWAEPIKADEDVEGLERITRGRTRRLY